MAAGACGKGETEPVNNGLRAPRRRVVPFTHRALAVVGSKNDLSKLRQEMFIWCYFSFLYVYMKKSRLKFKEKITESVLGPVLSHTFITAVDGGAGAPSGMVAQRWWHRDGDSDGDTAMVTWPW